MRRSSVTLILVIAATLVVAAPVEETTPVPADQLVPGGPLEGPNRDVEIYGGTSGSWSGAPRERGNVFSVTILTTIQQIEFYLNVPAPDTFYFSIYRKINDGILIGDYDQDFITSVSVSTTGEQWVSSGTISYDIDPAYYYYLSIAWDVATCTYYRGSQATPHVTGFGQLETGIPAGSGHTTPWTNTYASGAFPPYYQRLTFQIVPVELQSMSIE